jgi:hypothetical protein
MIATHQSERPAASKAEQAQRLFVEMLAAASQHGFYGTTRLELVVQDGHIQHMRVAVERVVK